MELGKWRWMEDDLPFPKGVFFKVLYLFAGEAGEYSGCLFELPSGKLT